MNLTASDLSQVLGDETPVPTRVTQPLDTHQDPFSDLRDDSPGRIPSPRSFTTTIVNLVRWIHLNRLLSEAPQILHYFPRTSKDPPHIGRRLFSTYTKSRFVSTNEPTPVGKVFGLGRVPRTGCGVGGGSPR